jgi:hypothetical protein
MTWFRRLVIGVTEFLLVVSMFVLTISMGMAGAVLGSTYFIGLNTTSIHFANLAPIPVGTVVGSGLGALIGFTWTCSLTAIIFAIAQIERNTRNSAEIKLAHASQPAEFRAAPRF